MFLATEYHIWASRQLSRMQAIAKSHAVHEPAHAHFRFRVLPSNTAHALAALRGRQAVGHGRHFGLGLQGSRRLYTGSEFSRRVFAAVEAPRRRRFHPPSGKYRDFKGAARSYELTPEMMNLLRTFEEGRGETPVQTVKNIPAPPNTNLRTAGQGFVQMPSEEGVIAPDSGPDIPLG